MMVIRYESLLICVVLLPPHGNWYDWKDGVLYNEFKKPFHQLLLPFYELYLQYLESFLS